MEFNGPAGQRSQAPPDAAQPVPLDDDLWLFRDTCNVYVVRDGSTAIAIDFGSGRWLEALPALGISRLEHVFLTHHHADQCHGLQARPTWPFSVHAPAGGGSVSQSARGRRADGAGGQVRQGLSAELRRAARRGGRGRLRRHGQLPADLLGPPAAALSAHAGPRPARQLGAARPRWEAGGVLRRRRPCGRHAVAAVPPGVGPLARHRGTCGLGGRGPPASAADGPPVSGTRPGGRPGDRRYPGNAGRAPDGVLRGQGQPVTRRAGPVPGAEAPCQRRTTGAGRPLPVRPERLPAGGRQPRGAGDRRNPARHPGSGAPHRRVGRGRRASRGADRGGRHPLPQRPHGRAAFAAGALRHHRVAAPGGRRAAARRRPA